MNDNKFLPAIIILVAIILAGLWYQFIYEPTQREILGMELETRRLHEVEREIVELLTRHENLAAFVEEKELQLDEAQNFLPTTLEQEKFIDELYRAADSRNVRIISIRVGDINSAGELQAQVVSANLEADYISLLNFIREVLDGGRLVTLEKISAGASKGTVACELEFKIFSTAPNS